MDLVKRQYGLSADPSKPEEALQRTQAVSYLYIGLRMRFVHLGFRITGSPVVPSISQSNVCGPQCRYTSCPELNDILHLQCKGIITLENLDVSGIDREISPC